MALPAWLPVSIRIHGDMVPEGPRACAVACIRRPNVGIWLKCILTSTAHGGMAAAWLQCGSGFRAEATKTRDNDHHLCSAGLARFRKDPMAQVSHGKLTHGVWQRGKDVYTWQCEFERACRGPITPTMSNYLGQPVPSAGLPGDSDAASTLILRLPCEFRMDGWQSRQAGRGKRQGARETGETREHRVHEETGEHRTQRGQRVARRDKGSEAVAPVRKLSETTLWYIRRSSDYV